MIAAPLVEETLFRGLLAESLRPRGMATAVWISAVAFAAWHWRIDSLRYYALMGAMLAYLYWKRGLVCSIATHACFNGVLTVAAIVLALNPGKTLTFDGVSITAPQGWHQAGARDGVSDGLLGIEGPSGAGVTLRAVRPLGPVNLDDPGLIDRIQSQLATVPGVTSVIDTDRVRTMDLPAGHAIEVPVRIAGTETDEVLVDAAPEVIVVSFVSGGSAKAGSDFQEMLRSLRVA
jgi:hypothetical protein